MSKPPALEPPRLRVIEGGRQSELVIDGLRVVAGPESEPPFPTDLRALEEDTYLVLSASPVVRPPREHPVRLMTGVIEQQPVPLGTVLVKGDRLLAVVHDLAVEPTTTRRAIARAFAGVMAQVARRRARSLALPLLGSVHGLFPVTGPFSAMRATLELRPECLERVWIVAPRRDLVEIEQLLAAWAKDR